MKSSAARAENKSQGMQSMVFLPKLMFGDYVGVRPIPSWMLGAR